MSAESATRARRSQFGRSRSGAIFPAPHCAIANHNPGRPSSQPERRWTSWISWQKIGINEIALIGGEAFLRADWLDIAAAITRAGMVCSMTTGGYGLSAPTALRMKRAGIRHVSVSLDGLEAAHDRLRGRQGSFASAIAALRFLADADLLIGANTQINRLTAPDLPIVRTAERCRRRCLANPAHGAVRECR